MVLFAVAAVVHLVKGPDPIAALLDVGDAGRAGLVSGPSSAPTATRRSLRQAVLFVPFYLLVVGVFGFVSLLTQRDFVTPDLTFGGMLETTYGGLIGLDGPYTFQHQFFADFFPDALLVLGIVGLLTLLVPGLPAAGPRPRPRRGGARARAARSCAPTARTRSPTSRCAATRATSSPPTGSR